MSNGKSLSAQAVLATAGVEANVQATYPIDANRDIHILAVDEKTALESAHKIAAVSEQTGFVPLFSREDYIVQKIKNSEIYHKQWEENIDSILASVPLMKADLADPIKLAGKMRPGSDEASLARVKARISQLLTHYQFANAFSGPNRHPIPIQTGTLFRSKSAPLPRVFKACLNNIQQ